MNKLTLRVRIILIACGALLGSLAVFSIALATTHPILAIEPQSETTTSTTYAITLTNNGDIFNVVEFELLFATSTTIEIDDIESALCRPELTVANTMTQGTAISTWYVACGTFSPFSGTTITLATFTIPHTSTPTPLTFGTSTALYRHDGLGTQIIPDTIGTTTSAVR
jgi:hypothetical protein